MKNILVIALLLFVPFLAKPEDGYKLWLRYVPIEDAALLKTYRSLITGLRMPANTPTLQAAHEELLTGLKGLGIPVANATPSIIVQTNLPQYKRALDTLGSEGFLIRAQNKQIFITANTDIGILYGCFHFLRLLQTHQPIGSLQIATKPAFAFRMLDHWDNLNRSVERGYAGISIWDWHTLPDYIDPRYRDYARANASIGINATVLNNVNANALILSKDWLIKVAALAKTFRPYGIKIYLSARFSAPIESGGLKTADPEDPEVRRWWKEKCNEIYTLIPDFGGFLVKANSEGQPGPQNYGRSHASGANMLAQALAPHKGIVIWRAFVYSNESPEDRAKQAFNEFKPLDGKFDDNVWVQVKNGPIDFQPREPYHPLFGAMPHTQLMPEFQLTQEYLGFSTHLVYLAPLIKECLDAIPTTRMNGIAAVSNIGNDIDWTGHPFAQSNWYAYGRLAWDPNRSGKEIAEEWTRQTFTNDPEALADIDNIMLRSREILVDYMTPLGLHHIMGYNHHYGPAPWYDKAPRADWNPVYFHKADTLGLGFDRTQKGSNALAQYPTQIASQWADPDKCPDELLLWFHHIPWDKKLHSGRTLWNELCHRYTIGADSAQWMQTSWSKLEKYIDPQRFQEVAMRLQIQTKEAAWWRNACLLYFQTFSRRPFPDGTPLPDHDLAWYEALTFPYAPGIQTK